MNEALLKHAIQTVWCTPGQDSQVIYELSRMGDPYGNLGSFWTPYERLSLPDTTHKWMVYQVGKVVPANINIPRRKNTWYRLDKLAKDRLLMSDLYTDNGLHFPRFESYCLLTSGDGLIVVTRVNDKIINLHDQKLYIRFYTNGYFASERSDGKRSLEIKGKRFVNTNEILLFQREIEEKLETFTGKTMSFINGRLVGNVSLVTAHEGDVVEVVFDPSITKMVEFNIRDLPSFNSTRDNLKKYLLHYYDPSVQRIDYIDDIDVFLVKKNGAKLEGVYYHQNVPEWMRMVTHKDYSVPVERVRAFLTQHTVQPSRIDDLARYPESDWANVDDLVLRLYIREAGWDRPLEPNAHRTEELYRLDDQDIQNALLGLHSNVDVWKAAELENSAYVRFMSAPAAQIRPTMFGVPTESSDAKNSAEEFAGDVYGYHAASKLLADTPSRVVKVGDVPMAQLHYEHWTDSTVFEYDADGRLLGHSYNVKSEWFPVVHQNAALVEAISGLGTTNQGEIFGNGEVDIPVGYNWRLYVSPVWAGKVTNEWVDITDSPDRDKYGILTKNVNGKHHWKWTLSAKTQYGLVRTDNQFILQDIELTTNDGLLEFSVNETLSSSNVVAIMPAGVLDIWLNGCALQEGLDYIVRWPQVVISNREYLDTSTTEQKVTYRAYGFPTTDGKLLDINQKGYVAYNVLSHDGVTEVHRNRVLRITAGGRYLHPDDVVYDEDNNNVVLKGARNGAPYTIQTPPVIFHDVYEDDIAARAKDDAIDKSVVDYLTMKLPQRKRPNPDMIPERYSVVSAFANKVLVDIKRGVLRPSKIEDHYSEQDIREWLKDYEWILDYDIIQQGYDEDYAVVVPKWWDDVVELDYWEYTFYSRILGLYLKTRPDIAKHIRIGGLA